MYLTGENTITMIAAILDVMPLDDAPGTPVSDSHLICNGNGNLSSCNIRHTKKTKKKNLKPET